MLRKSKSQFLSGKKLFTVSILTMGLVVFTNAQGITNTLGGNTANDKFIIENSDSEAGLVVTGEGNVGIGTGVPSVSLHISKAESNLLRLQKSTSGGGPLITFFQAATYAAWIQSFDNDFYIYNKLPGNLFLGTNNGNRLTVDSSGKVGIGTTTPGQKLTVAGTIESTTGGIKFPDGTIQTTAVSDGGGTVDGHSLDAADGNPIDAIYVNNDGNVGIGTTTPAYKLDVTGPANLNDGLSGVFLRANGAEAAWYDGYYFSWGFGGNYNYFADKVGIGSTNPLSKLSVGGNGYSGDAIYGETADGRGVFGRSIGTSGGQGVSGIATGKYGYGVVGSAPGSNGTGVTGSGTAYDFYADGPGTNYGSTSSIRWKKNIVEIDNPLEKIAELRGVYFDWDEEHGGKHDVGCIAEEVGKVLPEIVVYKENGIDASGMDYSKLTPLLVEVAKAHQKLIEELTKRVEELENR